jgi:hypothetical protein
MNRKITWAPFAVASDGTVRDNFGAETIAKRGGRRLRHQARRSRPPSGKSR